VLNTEVYSNTGGQARRRPLWARRRSSPRRQKGTAQGPCHDGDLYGDVYVAQVAMGANNEQAVIAFREAEAHDGPSLILAYSQCIAHGIDMRHGMKQAAGRSRAAIGPCCASTRPCGAAE
jgi:pyruvate-ferredoxin/flavodoxin oxidoreductase